MHIRYRLRPYQVEVARAILESVLQRRGLTFSVEIARQGGKNELSAQLEVALLTLFLAAGGNGIKASPTFKPQTIISMDRLKERLNDAGYNTLWVAEHGYTLRLGKARMVFLSAEPTSNVVGATAHWLMELDESQDISAEKFNRDFRPMGATTNCTTVLYGTAWEDASLLEQVKAQNLELEGRDGLRRHFQYDWQEVARHNPQYLDYVAGERQRLGEEHPLFQTQYCLRPLGKGGRLLSPQQRAQLQGEHGRYQRALPGRAYVAGIDLAGEDEGPEDAALRGQKPAKDSTVVTIGELDYSGCDAIIRMPQVRIVEHYWRTGVKHPELYAQLVDLLRNLWRCQRVVVDATGVGEAVASFLRSALGSRVVPFVFSAASKSKLGFAFLAALNAGRLKMYQPDGSEECREFWFQMERARSAFRASQTMNFSVDPKEGHDDFLMSAALLVEAAAGWEPRVAKSRAQA